jgi:hypothetical protein
MSVTYPIAIPIDTNHGRGETRAVGPTRITFATSELIEAGAPLRFSLLLRGSGNTPINVFGSGRIEAVNADGSLFIVDASVDHTEIALADKGERA